MQVQHTTYTNIIDKLNIIENKVTQISTDIQISQNISTKSYAEAIKNIQEIQPILSLQKETQSEINKSTTLIIKEVIQQKIEHENRENNIMVYNLSETENDTEN